MTTVSSAATASSVSYALRGSKRDMTGLVFQALLLLSLLFTLAVLLILLAVTHVVIMHVVNNVSQIDFNFVAHRWGSPFWRSFDWLLLILALLHGFNGARLSVDDYIRNRGWRIFAHSVIWSALIIFIVLGTIAIVTFNPATFSNATASAGR